MATKIIVLKDAYVPDKSIFSEKGKTIIVANEQAYFPISLLEVIKGEFEVIYAGRGSDSEYAFKLGELHAVEKNAKVYTNDKVLLSLFEGKPQAKTKNQRTKTPKPTQVLEEKPVKNPVQEKEPKNEVIIPAPEKKEKAKEKTAPKKAASQGPAKTASLPKGTDLSKIEKKDIEKLLKKGGFDVKYAEAVKEALKDASPVTADLLVRTKLSVIEPDKDICFSIGELIKKTYC